MPESNTMLLKYLFRVEFTDGSFFEQKYHDISDIDPTRSQFYDLLQLNKPMRRAWLFPALYPWKGKVMVDLWTGEFEVKGLPLQIDQNPLPSMQRELIFFREHQHDANATYLTQTGEVTQLKEIDHRVKYFIGWRVNINGTNRQQIVGLQ